MTPKIKKLIAMLVLMGFKQEDKKSKLYSDYTLRSNLKQPSDEYEWFLRINFGDSRLDLHHSQAPSNSSDSIYLEGHSALDDLNSIIQLMEFTKDKLRVRVLLNKLSTNKILNKLSTNKSTRDTING